MYVVLNIHMGYIAKKYLLVKLRFWISLFDVLFHIDITDQD